MIRLRVSLNVRLRPTKLDDFQLLQNEHGIVALGENLETTFKIGINNRGRHDGDDRRR